MDELTLDDKKYLSSKRAAQVTGYAKDYVGQLCREGRVDARLVGRNWYVLESSILEHRFGADEAIEEPKSAPPEPVSAWEPPRYISEPVQIVPEIAPKPIAAPPRVAPAPPVPDPSPMADMQSAWAEWFERQKAQEAALPDASEMLLEESYDDATIEAAPEPVYESVESETEPVAVHIERIATPEPVAEEPVQIARHAASPTVSYVAPSGRRVKPSKRSGGAGSTLMARSLFIAIAGLAIVVAIIGSGLADTYLQTGQTSFITDILGGINNISK